MSRRRRRPRAQAHGQADAAPGGAAVADQQTKVLHLNFFGGIWIDKRRRFLRAALRRTEQQAEPAATAAVAEHARAERRAALELFAEWRAALELEKADSQSADAADHPPRRSPARCFIVRPSRLSRAALQQ